MRLRHRILGAAGAAIAAGLLAFAPASAAQAAVFVGQTTSLTPVLLVGGSGSYTFNSIACVEAPSPAGLCSITSSGTYTNTVCGTGAANGVATVTPGPTFSYHIQFVSGVGVLTGGATGAVLILPKGVGGLASCVTGFIVVGAGII